MCKWIEKRMAFDSGLYRTVLGKSMILLYAHCANRVFVKYVTLDVMYPYVGYYYYLILELPKANNLTKS